MNAQANVGNDPLRVLLVGATNTDAELTVEFLESTQTDFSATVRASTLDEAKLHAHDRKLNIVLLDISSMQTVTGDNVDIAYVDQGYTGARAANAAAAHGITLEVIKLPEAKRGFVLLPRRWVVERSFAWATRFRRLVKDYERYAQTLAGLHVVAFACIMMKQAAAIAAGS